MPAIAERQIERAFESGDALGAAFSSHSQIGLKLGLTQAGVAYPGCKVQLSRSSSCGTREH